MIKSEKNMDMLGNVKIWFDHVLLPLVIFDIAIDNHHVQWLNHPTKTCHGRSQAVAGGITSGIDYG